MKKWNRIDNVAVQIFKKKIIWKKAKINHS